MQNWIEWHLYQLYVLQELEAALLESLQFLRISELQKCIDVISI